MNQGWLAVLILSSTALIAVLIRSRISWAWVMRLGLQIVAAALLLYVLNESGWIAGVHVPMNPITLAAVIMLGVPGIFLVLGLEWIIVG